MAQSNENGKRLVEMLDGRKVEFGKVAKVKKTIIIENGSPVAIRFDAANGDTETVEIDDLPAAIFPVLIAHGLSQKLGDEYADLDSIADCMEAMRSLWARLCGGEWSAERQGFAGAGILFEAACLVYPNMDQAAIRKILADMKPREREALKQDAEFKPHIEALLAKRAKGVDTEALKGKFAAPQQQ